ncbi:S9 family peptidase [Bifidobacterium aesculapii]|uniref:S9 family peptidase n=1 Tax=Bifidobacterium aesculapii TaxID=1329411 RepID=UPI0006E3620F|nr:prolyl oligopeptidase family serine peptidase [Bifidobacterium aesculapii]
MNDAIIGFPRAKARTLRFTCGAPRSAKAIRDGSAALFLRSDGPEDLVTALWLSWFDAAGEHHETKLADPRDLLGAEADSEDVPAEEKARRERAREGGAGIVGYSVCADGDRVVFTINGRLFLTEITWDDDEPGVQGNAPDVATRELAGEWLDEDPDLYTPVLNPRISPDGDHVLYTTGEHLMLVDIGDWPDEYIDDDDYDGDDYEPLDDRVTAIYGVAVEDEDGEPAENTWRIGLAEFVAGEEMDRYDGFWWSPDSRHVLFESFDTADEPTWFLSDPADPEHPAAGRRYPRALTRNADVYLTAITLAFDEDDRYMGITANADVAWDRESYEYVAAVSWTRGHDPLVLVQNRRQTRDQVLEVAVAGTPDRAFGETRVLEEHANGQWIDLIHGTPAFTPDGRLVCAWNDMAGDTNRLTVDGRAFTPEGWNVRTVLDVTDDDVLAVVQREPDLAPDGPLGWRVFARTAYGDDAADESRVGAHDARSFDVVSFGFDGSITPVTSRPGVWTASRSGDGIVVTGRSMARAGVTMTHSFALGGAGIDAVAGDVDEEAARDDATVAVENDEAELSVLAAPIANHATDPGFAPDVTFTRLGAHRLYTAIVAPSADSPYAQAEKLPVLMKPYGGPGFQQVVAAQSFYWDAQWWADQGFLVVTADGRGTTGRGPRWDREIFEDMKDVTLADQIEAVRALPDAVVAINAARAGVDAAPMPAPDLGKVCMIGWSYGGFLSALAVLDAPDVFAAACAGAPPTDWTLYDTHYTERYLGLDPEVYERNSIVADAPKLDRPLMLIHGFADDNVTIAHSLRLSQALMAAGRPHTFLPLTGITHMTNDETVAENLLTLQRDFLKSHLG